MPVNFIAEKTELRIYFYDGRTKTKKTHKRHEQMSTPFLKHYNP